MGHRAMGVWCVVFISLLVTGATAADEGREPPNLIFLLADDQCTYSLGCYGTPGVKTPHIDQLARDGMAFDNHYVSTAICMASRATIMTGLYEYRTGCNFEHGPLVAAHWRNTYPMLLRDAGYRTGFAGKFGFEVTPTPGKRGKLPAGDFDSWGGGPGQTFYETAKNESMRQYAKTHPHSTLSYAAFAADFIDKAVTDRRPFCLSISFKAPHRPVTPDPAFDHVYAGARFTKPANYGRRYGEHFAKQSQQGRQFERFHSWNYSDKYDEVMALYYQQIYAIDVAVGRIRKALEATGVSENTVIVFTSDNGFLCGSHGYGSKVLPYEESSRVPLVIFDPRHKNSGKGQRSGALTGNIDLAPTLLDLAGVEPPAGIDGTSLVPLYDDPGAEVRKALTLVNVWGPRPVHSLSVVTRDWKYIYWPYTKAKQFTPTEELYHLTKDPLELANLVSQPSADAQRATMRRAYDAAVAHWKRHAVPFHRYAGFADFFARQP